MGESRIAPDISRTSWRLWVFEGLTSEEEPSGTPSFSPSANREVVTPVSTCRHNSCAIRVAFWGRFSGSAKSEIQIARKIKIGRQPRSGYVSLAIGPLDPERDRR